MMARPISMRTFVLFCLAGLLLSAVLLTGCEKKLEAPGPRVMTDEEYESWEIALVEMRIEKNEDFRNPQQSPLMQQDLEGFEALNYYFPVRGLVYRLPFTAAAATDTVFLTKRKGEAVPYLRRGTVAFAHGGDTYQLSVFGPADVSRGDYLWLPFYDKTSGEATYGGGRYLDVEVNAEGLVDLDFNYAYNPLCDYNPEQFNCTLPPTENRLDFAVEAGEKSFGGGH